MNYDTGETVKLGDVVKLYSNNIYTAMVIALGDSCEYCNIDEQTAKWAFEVGHIEKDSIMVEFQETVFQSDNFSKYAPVSNTLSLKLHGVEFARRAESAIPSNKVNCSPKGSDLAC